MHAFMHNQNTDMRDKTDNKKNVPQSETMELRIRNVPVALRTRIEVAASLRRKHMAPYVIELLNKHVPEVPNVA